MLSQAYCFFAALPLQMRLIRNMLLPCIMLAAMSQPAFPEEKPTLTAYSARKDELIRPLLDRFEEKSGIRVNVLSDDAAKLIARLQMEGKTSPADVLLTVDVANIALAAKKDLLAPMDDAVLLSEIPAAYRDPKHRWFGLTKRARLIFYNKQKVTGERAPQSYEALAAPEWKGELLIRSSAHPYNLALTSAMMEKHGTSATAAWLQGIMTNLARTPQGGDSDQLRAAAAGEGSVAVSNSYYYARMLTSDLPEDRAAAQKLGVIIPNQQPAEGELQGAHVNISAAGVAATSMHKANALKLLQFLASEEGQRLYAELNYEFPVNPAVATPPAQDIFGEMVEDPTPLADFADASREAAMLADRAGWK